MESGQTLDRKTSLSNWKSPNISGFVAFFVHRKSPKFQPSPKVSVLGGFFGHLSLTFECKIWSQSAVCCVWYAMCGPQESSTPAFKHNRSIGTVLHRVTWSTATRCTSNAFRHRSATRRWSLRHLGLSQHQCPSIASNSSSILHPTARASSCISEHRLILAPVFPLVIAYPHNPLFTPPQRLHHLPSHSTVNGDWRNNLPNCELSPSPCLHSASFHFRVIFVSFRCEPPAYSILGTTFVYLLLSLEQSALLL